MKLRSFRWRIAFLSALLAGAAVTGFAVVAWQLIYVAKVNRLDAKLENQMRRSLRPRTPQAWQMFAASLPRELDTDAETLTALLVVCHGQVEFQSAQWSPEFQVDFPPPPNLPRRSPLPPTPQSPWGNGVPLPRLPLHRERSDLPPRRDWSERVLFAQLQPRIVTQTTSTGRWRISFASFPDHQVAIAVSLQAVAHEMGLIRNIFLVAIPGTLLLVAGGAWLLAGSALRPIQQLTQAMQHLTVTGLNQRISPSTTDEEFVELIYVFNQMLERLERSFKQASRFSADAAHELNTPLAILQGELEQALQQADLGSANQQRLTHLLDEVRRLSGIVRKLLLLSLADAGQMNVHKTQVNLSEILTTIVEDSDLLAPHLAVTVEIEPDLSVWGDRDLLTQALQNLVSNAIKYNLADGWIHLKAGHLSTQHPTTIEIVITNASEDIPIDQRDRIFDRFYRVNPARDRRVEGVGLGLSLSREIVRAHHGSLTLGSSIPGQTSLIVALPDQTRR